MVGRFILVAACIAGLVPAAFGQLTNRDRTFVMNAAQANNFQLQAALLANEYSSNPEFRRYAIEIANAQTEQSGQLEFTVADQNSKMRLPNDLSPTGQSQLNALKNAKNVDATFRNEMISSYSSTIRMYQHYIDQPDANEGLTKMVEDLLPTLEQHLEDARNVGAPPPPAKSHLF
jgi:predicted outer membrane protein